MISRQSKDPRRTRTRIRIDTSMLIDDHRYPWMVSLLTDIPAGTIILLVTFS